MKNCLYCIHLEMITRAWQPTFIRCQKRKFPIIASNSAIIKKRMMASFITAESCVDFKQDDVPDLSSLPNPTKR